MPQSVTIEASGNPHAKRLVRNGDIVAMLLALTNGRWGIYDTNERQLTKQTFSSPAKARKGFLELEQQKTAD